MACLKIMTGEQAGKSYSVANRPLAGGRDPAREIQIVDARVSRKHFVIRKDGDGHVIVDLRSENGVCVNGVKIDEARLQDGDQITVGGTTLAYFSSDDPAHTDALQEYRKAGRALREDRTITD